MSPAPVASTVYELPPTKSRTLINNDPLEGTPSPELHDIATELDPTISGGLTPPPDGNPKSPASNSSGESGLNRNPRNADELLELETELLELELDELELLEIETELELELTELLLELVLDDELELDELELTELLELELLEKKSFIPT